MKKYVYKNKKTGEKVYSDKPLQDENLKLVMRVMEKDLNNKDHEQSKK